LTGGGRANTNALVLGPHLSTSSSIPSTGSRRLALLLLGAGVHVACLPLDDLSNYSSAWERQTSEVVNGLSPDASAPSDGADSGVMLGAEAPFDAGGPLAPVPEASDGGSEPAVDAAPNESADAGEPPLVDAGSALLDAGATL